MSKPTIELDIPRDAAERVRRQDEWNLRPSDAEIAAAAREVDGIYAAPGICTPDMAKRAAEAALTAAARVRKGIKP